MIRQMIRTRTKAALNRYVNNHIFPGGFLTAVLTNNLRVWSQIK
jgi:hypothetical protein